MLKQAPSTPLQPFLKWAGGKRWMIPDLYRLVAQRKRRHVEPFLGSGAFFFHARPESAFLSDSNRWLIETYNALKEDPDEIINILEVHEKFHSKDYYYLLRSRRYDSGTERAAQLIYLNRTCWNALFRVNLKGEFNVPIGTKTNVMQDRSNFYQWSLALRAANIQCLDFYDSFASVGANDFVFADPPYVTAHSKNGFLKYNQKIFSWSDQMRLASCAKAAADRGALVVVTNAPHESVLDLYTGLGAEIHTVERASVIAAASENRKRVAELIAVLGH